MCSHFELVCFLVNASRLIETSCYLNSMNTCHTLLFCDFREVGSFKYLSGSIEFPDNICIFCENNSILLFALNFSKVYEKKKNTTYLSIYLKDKTSCYFPHPSEITKKKPLKIFHILKSRMHFQWESVKTCLWIINSRNTSGFWTVFFFFYLIFTLCLTLWHISWHCWVFIAFFSLI